MLKFKPVTMQDRDLINRYLKIANYRCCDYHFQTMIMWLNSYALEYAEAEGFLLIHTSSEEKNAYFAPIGVGDAGPAVDLLIERSQEILEPLAFVRVVPNAMETLKSREHLFTKQRDRGMDDYIYLSEGLASLKGKKLHSKRTNINKFNMTYRWKYEPITPENVNECKVMNKQWCRERNCCADEELENESSACAIGLKDFEELGLCGGLLRVDDKVIAFTVASPLFPGSNILDVHYEKALDGYNGAYTMINQQFALQMKEQYQYFDREEDIGIEGLRRAKLSYNPVMLEEQYNLFYKGNE